MLKVLKELPEDTDYRKKGEHIFSWIKLDKARINFNEHSCAVKKKVFLP